MSKLKLQPVTPSDYPSVIAIVNEWWGGRNMTDMLPKLFFTHFRNTSFVVRQGRDIVGFLVGFISQSSSGEAYIHFIGVHPAYRNQGIGRKLYERFFSVVYTLGCNIVRCVTSPANKGSVSFHQRLGFTCEPGDNDTEGVPFTRDYDGKGEDRVLFKRRLPHDQAL